MRDVLLAWQSGLVDALRAAVLAQPADQPPLAAVCGALIRLSAEVDPAAAVHIAKLLRANDRLRAANQSKFLQMEQAAFESLCRLWPQRSRRNNHRIVAMMALGALRIAVDGWAERDGKLPFGKCVEQGFEGLRAACK